MAEVKANVRPSIPQAQKFLREARDELSRAADLMQAATQARYLTETGEATMGSWVAEIRSISDELDAQAMNIDGMEEADDRYGAPYYGD